MKKLLYTIASLAALTVIACTKEQGTPEVRPEIPDTPEEVIEVPATLSGSMGDPATKVSNDNNGAYKWQASDHVTILTNKGANREFSADEAGLTTKFSGHIPNTDALVGGFALYPASSNLEAAHHSISGTTITFNIPTTLTWGADASYMPMYAPIATDPENAEKVKASFKAVGGAMKLICYNIPEGATTLAFTANVKIAGNFTLDTTAETPTLSGEGTTGKEIDIDFSGNYSANKVFYIPLPPVTLAGGFTITIFDSGANELYEKTTTAAPTIARNHLVIAPALNCGAAPADATLTNAEMQSGLPTSAYGDGTISSTSGTWNFVQARYISYKMQMKKLSDAGYLKLPVFSSNLLSITLNSVQNGGGTAYSGTVSLFESTDTSEDAIATKTASNVDNGNIEVSIPEIVNTGYLYSDGVIRFTSITVKFRGTDATVPTISAGADELTIPVGSLSATINSVALANNVDGLGISADIVSQTPEGWIDTAVIENGTLTVTAKAANTNAVDNTATIKLKASGAAAYPITVTQTSCLVQAPSSYTAVAGDETATISWTKDEHASSYLAYLHTSATATPASGGTDVTSALTLNNGTYSLTKNDLTNNTTYYLYVKVNAVASNYQASPAYTSVSFTPRKASTEADPYKASEAYDNISSYASGEGPDDDIYVEGYVYTAEAPASNSQTYTIIWGDATTKALQVFEGKQISNADITDANKVSVGDYVKVKGAAINYNGDTPRLTSGNVILTHYPKLAAPTFSLSPDIPDDVDENKFYEAQTVTLSATNSADIYYTLDDSEPTTSSTHYTSPFAVSSIKTTTIKAIAVKANYTTSAVGEKAITIAASTQLVMSTITATADEDYINFSWTAVENATGYQVSTDGGSNYGETQAATSYKWENLTPSTSYTLYVKAIGTTNKKYTDSVAGSKTQSTNAPTPGWKETALSNIGASDVFVIVGDDGYALPNDNGTSSAPSTVSVAVSGTKLTGSEGNDGVIADKIKWNVSSNNEGYVFYPNGSTTTWLYCTNTNNGVRVGDNANKLFTLTKDGYLLNTATSRYISVYNNSDWRCYANTSNNPQVVKFYKYTDNTPRTITVSTPSNGTVTTDPSGTTTAGTTVNITAIPSSGYSVRTVSVLDGNSAAVSVTKDDDTHYHFSMPSSNATVTVTFGIKSAVSIAYGTDPAHGSISISPASPVFQGETVTVTATPDDGYELSALTYNDGSAHDILSGKTFTMPASDVTVTATFAAVATISVTNPITNVSATAGTYTINNAYTLLNNATSANVTVAEPDNTVVTAVSKGASDGSISITVNGNTGAARNGSFKIKYGNEAYRTITVNQLAGSSTPDVGTVLFSETFGSSAVSPFSSYTGTGSSSYNSASTLTYTCKSSNTKIMNDTQGDCGPANLLVGGKNGGSGEWAKISGIKTYGATQVTVTWASNGTVVKVSIEESSSAAVTSAASASNSGTFTLTGEEETITLVMTAGSKSNGRVDSFQITVAE